MRRLTVAVLVSIALFFASFAWAQFRRVDSSIEAHLPRAHYEQLAVGKGQRVFVSPTSVAVFPQSVGGKSARSA